jgi:hypothetical protein
LILNGWTVTAAFLAVCSAALGLVTVAALLRARARARARRAAHQGEAGSLADLLGLLIGALVIVRLVALPLHYLVLKSYVPFLADQGVMCAYGVTRVQAGWVRAVQTLGPAFLFTGGLWLALAAASARPRLVLAGVAASLALISSVSELIYLAVDKGGQAVTCCTQFSSVPATFERAGVRWTASPFAQPVVFGALQLVLLGGAWSMARSTMGRRNARALLGPALALAGVANLWVSHVFWRDELAPRVLGLPYHRCVYELLTDTRALGLAALFLLMATACVVWPPLLRRAPGGEQVGRALYRAGAWLQLSSLLLVVLHVV